MALFVEKKSQPTFFCVCVCGPRCLDTQSKKHIDTGWRHNFLSSDSTLHRPMHHREDPSRLAQAGRGQLRVCGRALRDARGVPGTRLGPAGPGLPDTAPAFQHAPGTSSPAVITFRGQGLAPWLRAGWPCHRAADWAEGPAHVVGL